MAGDGDRTHDPERAPVTGLAAAPPPKRELTPSELESYVRAAMHQDRSPGRILAICHPLRLYKVPRGLFAALEEAGFEVQRVDTHPDRVQSVTGIRDALHAARSDDVPLDVLVISGDGSLDHHVLVAAFWAFYPDLVHLRPGSIDTSAVGEYDVRDVPSRYRRAFLEPLPSGATLEPNDDTIRQIWLLRSQLEPLLRAGRSVSRILRSTGRERDDAMLRVAVLSTLLPHLVTLRAHGFDLTGLASATVDDTFQGLYPYIRSLTVYPAGTAADNAQFAGVPGWVYAQLSKVLGRFSWLEGTRAALEERATRRFLDFFTLNSVVVPARFSVVAFDGDWQLISSHAAGGPAAGHFFSADLSSKTKGLLGYLARIPTVVLREGIFGSTIVRIRARTAQGRLKALTEGQLAEGLYTNRAFIAGVGSVPATNPTSFSGRSSLIVTPPLWARDDAGQGHLDFRGVGTLTEAILKGVLARVLHMLGFNVGSLAGGGKFRAARPEHQITLREGEEVDIEYLARDRTPRFVPTQVSGDPFQARRMTIRVAWGPLPMLAANDSLLMSSTRRSLAALRVEQTYALKAIYIGGLQYFRHQVGAEWSAEATERTGLFEAPIYLPRPVARTKVALIDRWQPLGTGVFVDTSEQGMQLGRRGVYAHNNDQSAHLVLLRDSRTRLLVRLVRSKNGNIFETRATYRAFGPTWIIHDSQTRMWSHGEDPRILQEVHYFRDAEAFRQEAPAFFPFITTDPEEPTLREITEEIER